tara:strand:+ start:12965 stop:13561 length:597 start_codon:yes stop_codon:yes gene_type:complete
MIIGITGGIGSGKSMVSSAFCSLDNTKYYHADSEAKALIESSSVIRNKIIDVFGKESYIDKKFNRKYISSLVFKEPSLLKKLNSIVHPFVNHHFKIFIKSQKKNTIIIYENAILFETNGNSICNTVISVNAPINIRIKRVINRDAVSEKYVKDVIENQWSDIKRNLLSNYIIYNIDKNETLLKIKDIYKILTKKSLLF